MRLDPTQIPNTEPQETGSANPKPPKKKHTGLIIGVGIILVIVLFFIWRILFYYVQIVRGDVIPPQSFINSITLDSRLESAGPTDLTDAEAQALATPDDPQIGAAPDKALLTIVEFADFGCPFSREASYVVRTLANYTDSVRYVYRDFPIVELHPNADIAAEAGECAREQQSFFDYHDKLYQNQHDLSAESLKRYAKELGLDSTSFDLCLDSRRYQGEVEEDRLAGVEAGVRGTPTFFLNGTKVEGSIPRDFFLNIVNRFADTASKLQQL